MISIASMILLGIICFASLCLIWVQWFRYNQKLHETLKLLEKSQEHERQLQDDVKALKTKIKHTMEDKVTQLPNWHLFEDRLHQSIKESERYQLALGVLIVDLDGFKLVNDLTDYKTGDVVLQEVGRRLKRSIRQVDSVSRFSKDTFVVMVTRLAKPETAALVAQRILQALVQPFEVKEESLRLTASIGISTYPQDGQDSASLMQAADHALKAAKSKGQHRYEFFQPEMYNLSRRILLLSSSLNSAEVMNDFTIRYQPIVNASTEEIICMDALLSWDHTELGKIETGELLQLAEKQQKLSMVADWLVNSACKEFVRWNKLGFRPSLLGITLPMSLLQSSSFVCRLSQMMKDTGFDPTCLLLQIKSSEKASSYEVLEKSFNMLHYLGVKIAMDDFGSGGLSLAQLKQFPVNYFKLDKALLSDVGSNPQTAILIQSTLELAQSMGAQLIVQGVETQEQLRLLKEAGCELIEGQAVGVPLSEDEVTTQVSE